MAKQVLITGGAGFVGSHLADDLLARGYRVRALDNLSPQVHGPDRQRPDYLDPDVDLLVGDVRDRDAVRKALEGVDLVCHFAAMVGVGQSMYEVEQYTSVNNLGTAVLLEALIEKPVERLIVASSMSLYGEGLYVGGDGKPRPGVERTRSSRSARWSAGSPSSVRSRWDATPPRHAASSMWRVAQTASSASIFPIASPQRWRRFVR